MTKREVYNAILNGQINDEVLAEVEGYIATLDKANDKRKAKKSEEQSAVDEKVLAVLTTEAVKANAIAEATEYTISKVVASCKRLEKEGKVVITKKEKGSRNISYYALAESNED